VSFSATPPSDAGSRIGVAPIAAATCSSVGQILSSYSLGRDLPSLETLGIRFTHPLRSMSLSTLITVDRCIPIRSAILCVDGLIQG
jgi:hypothetical protein